MAKAPAYQWYPGDFRRDVAVQSCSFEARALWREMLDLMHDGEPYGHLTAGGVPIDEATLARLVGVDKRKISRWMSELEAREVFSRTDAGIVYSRRMVRDEEVRRKRAAGGKLGGNPALKKGGRKVGEKVNLPPNLPPTPASASASASASAIHSTLSNESGGGDAAPPPPRSIHAELMPVLREVGLETTGEGGKTNGSILKALDRKGVDRQEAEYAIRGLALRWRSGRLLGFGPDTPPDLRLLYGKRDASAAANKRPLWPQCVDEYLRHLSSKRKPAPGPVRITVGVSNG